MREEDRLSIEEELSEVASEIHDLEGLLKHSGWGRLHAFIKDQMTTRSATCMLTPINNEYSAFAQEMFKGEYAGMALIERYPETQIELAKARRTVLLTQLERDNETEARMAAHDASRRIPEPGDSEPDPFGE